MHFPFAHDPRDSESSVLNPQTLPVAALRRQKRFDDFIQPRMLAAVILHFGNRHKRIAADIKQRQPRRCAADVPGQNHGQDFFSKCPPNSYRIADNSLSANSASPRELKR